MKVAEPNLFGCCVFNRRLSSSQTPVYFFKRITVPKQFTFCFLVWGWLHLINYNYEKYAVYNLYKSGCVVIPKDYLIFSHWRFRTFPVVHLSFQIVTPKRFGYLMLLSTMCAPTEMTRLLLYPEHCNILISLFEWLLFPVFCVFGPDPAKYCETLNVPPFPLLTGSVRRCQFTSPCHRRKTSLDFFPPFLGSIRRCYFTPPKTVRRYTPPHFLILSRNTYQLRILNKIKQSFTTYLSSPPFFFFFQTGLGSLTYTTPKGFQ